MFLHIFVGKSIWRQRRFLALEWKGWGALRDCAKGPQSQSMGTWATKTNFSLVGKYYFSRNVSAPFPGRHNDSVVTVNVLPTVNIKLYICVSSRPRLPCLVLKQWRLRTVLRIGSQEMIVLFGECAHCACDCRSADNCFMKDHFPIMPAKPGVWCYLPPILNHLLQ